MDSELREILIECSELRGIDNLKVIHSALQKACEKLSTKGIKVTWENIISRLSNKSINISEQENGLYIIALLNYRQNKTKNMYDEELQDEIPFMLRETLTRLRLEENEIRSIFLEAFRDRKDISLPSIYEGYL